MLNPTLAEDSTPVTLSPSLSDIISKLDEKADKNDYIMAFFIVVMSETGYRVASLYDEESE